MKKCVLIISLLLILTNSFASFNIAKKVDSTTEVARDSKGQLPGEGMDSLPMAPETIANKKMSFLQKLEFKLFKNRIEHQLKKPSKQTSGFNIKGFLLGFLLPFYGVIIAYIFSKDRNFRKWAWIGLGTGLIVMLLVLFCVMLANFK